MAKRKTPTLADLKSTAEVSVITGQAPRTIGIHANKYGLGVMIGRARYFTAEDIEELKKHRNEAPS